MSWMRSICPHEASLTINLWLNLMLVLIWHLNYASRLILLHNRRMWVDMFGSSIVIKLFFTGTKFLKVKAFSVYHNSKMGHFCRKIVPLTLLECYNLLESKLHCAYNEL